MNFYAMIQKFKALVGVRQGSAPTIETDSSAIFFDSAGKPKLVIDSSGVESVHHLAKSQGAGHEVTLTTSGTTDVSLPTSGTLATLGGTEVLTNKTLTSPTVNTSISGTALNTDLAATAENNKVPTAAATKSYADSAAATRIAGMGAVTDNRLVKTSGITGTAVEQTGISVDDSNNVTGVTQLTAETVKATTALEIEDPDAGTNKVTVVADTTLSSDVTLTLPKATGTFATLAGTETLTNKYFDGGTASSANKLKLPSDTYANLVALAGKAEGQVFYATDTDKVYYYDGTNLQPVGSGSGSGEKNYVTNPSAATDVTGWNAVGDLAVARTTTAADLPREYTTASGIKITADADTQSVADYVYFDFNLDDVDLNKKLKLSWSQKMTGTYASGDLAVVITTQADRTTALHTPVTTSIPNVDGVFTTSFDSAGTAALSLVIRATTDMATNGGLVISDVLVGPGSVVQGAVVEEWKSFASNPTNLPQRAGGEGSYKYRRVGTDVEIFISMQLDVSSSTSEATITLPWSINTNLALNSIKGYGDVPKYGSVVGSFTLSDSASGYNTADKAIAVKLGSSNALIFAYPVLAGVTAQVGQICSPSYAKAAIFRATIPIAEWAGSGTVNLAQNDVEYASNSSTATTGNDTTSFAYGAIGSAIPAITGLGTRRVKFQSTIQSTDKFRIEFSNDNGTNWYPVEYGFGGVNISFVNQNGVNYGLGISTVSIANNYIDVRFGTYAYNSSTYGAVGVAWSTDFSTGRWRVCKTSAGAAVSFSTVSSTSAGLMPATNSNLDDATATRLGLKQYLHGTTYNGGNAPTISPSSGSVSRGVFIPYQTQGGVWRLRFNIKIAGTTNGCTFTINSVTVSYDQAFSGTSDVVPDFVTGFGFVLTNDIFYAKTNSGTVAVYLSGDIELDAKPNWAY